jgi:hypothetical protein
LSEDGDEDEDEDEDDVYGFYISYKTYILLENNI